MLRQREPSEEKAVILVALGLYGFPNANVQSKQVAGMHIDRFGYAEIGEGLAVVMELEELLRDSWISNFACKSLQRHIRAP